MELAMTELLGVAHAVAAAQQAGLLGALAGDERRSARAWAEALALDERATQVVLDVLVAAGIAEHTPLGYAASPAARAFFERVPGGAALALSLWSGIGELLATGQPVFDMDGDARARSSAYAGVVASLGEMFDAVAGKLAEALPGRPRRVLDVGCGSGVWGLALAGRSADASVTGLDWPPVLEAFTERARKLGLGGRAATLPGDMHEVPLPVGHFDVVLIANVLRLETPAKAEALVRRLAPAVAPDGALVVVDALAQGSREKDLARATYALHLALRTRAARVHAPDDVAAWLAAAGMVDVRAIDLGVQPGAVAAIVGRVPAVPHRIAEVGGARRREVPDVAGHDAAVSAPTCSSVGSPPCAPRWTGTTSC